MVNKGRRPWRRGEKKRYSLYKTEDRIEGEGDYEGWAKRIADAKGYDLTQFYAHDTNPRWFWQETYYRVEQYHRDTTGNLSPDQQLSLDD